MEERKRRTLGGIFIKYVSIFCGNTIVLALIMISAFIILVNVGALFPANYAERKLNENREKIIGADEVTEELIPLGSSYGVYDAAGRFLYGSFDEAERKEAWSACEKKQVSARGGGYYQFIFRENGEVCIVKYRMKTQASSAFIRKYLPSPDLCIVLLFILLFLLQAAAVSRHFSSMLSERLKVLNNVTGKIQGRDLEFARERSDIREIDEALVSLYDMGEALSCALKDQWRLEKDRREQVAALAHDIKTPLTVIKGNAELLEEETKGEPAGECIRYIRESTAEIEHYLMLLTDMLLTEEKAGEVREVEAAELAGQLSERAKRLAAGYSGGRLRAEVSIEKPLSGWVICEQEQILRAWDNILSNAVEYTLPDEVRPSRRDMYYGMPCGYTLPDEVRPSRRDMYYGMPCGYTLPDEVRPLLIRIEKTKEGGKSYLAARVSDRGKGFSKEDLAHAKEQFYQSDKSRHDKSHRGLGLYTAARSASRQGGKLILENAPEEEYGGKVSLLLALEEK